MKLNQTQGSLYETKQNPRISVWNQTQGFIYETKPNSRTLFENETKSESMFETKPN